MYTETVEDYLKAISELETTTGEATTSSVAWAMPLSQPPCGVTFHVEPIRDRNRDALRHLGRLALGSELPDLPFGVPA
jgi:hypothetical protein